MAWVFPQDAHRSRASLPARRALAAVLARLPEEWVVLIGQRIGTTPVDAVLVHPDLGVALIELGPRRPSAARAALEARCYLEEFDLRFPGDLPIVALAIARHELDRVGEALAAAFGAAPSLTVRDPGWAAAVLEIFLPGALSRETHPTPAASSEAMRRGLGPSRAQLIAGASGKAGLAGRTCSK